MMNKGLLLATAVVLLVATEADSVEPLSTPELAEHCAFYHDDPEGKDAIFCVRYIQGFIDGAVATDARVIENIADELDNDETYSQRFSERAFRTRLGYRTNRLGPTVYADFCIGEPESLVKVVEKVVDDLANREVLEEELLARDAVFSTLRREYPCVED